MLFIEKSDEVYEEALPHYSAFEVLNRAGSAIDLSSHKPIVLNGWHREDLPHALELENPVVPFREIAALRDFVAMFEWE